MAKEYFVTIRLLLLMYNFVRSFAEGKAKGQSKKEKSINFKNMYVHFSECHLKCF